MSSDEDSKPDVPLGRKIAYFPSEPVSVRGKLKDPNAYGPTEEEDESGRTATGASSARTHWATLIGLDRSKSSSAQKRDRFLPSDSSLDMGQEKMARKSAIVPSPSSRKKDQSTGQQP
jgi:hypothetical protein